MLLCYRLLLLSVLLLLFQLVLRQMQTTNSRVIRLWWYTGKLKLFLFYFFFVKWSFFGVHLYTLFKYSKMIFLLTKNKNKNEEICFFNSNYKLIINFDYFCYYTITIMVYSKIAFSIGHFIYMFITICLFYHLKLCSEKN